MDMRELKGLEIAARAKITFDGVAWFVPSQSGNGKYKVVLKPGASTCTCEDFQLRQEPCKHIHAARIVRERDGGEPAPALDTDAVPKRPTYKQNWPLYNLAQATEKHRFQALLFELCQGIQEPARKPKRGRPQMPLSDAAFACAFKIYSTFSTRRFACDLSDAHAKGYLSRPVHYNCVNAYLEDAEITPILHDLIVRASLPLKAIETDFATDSTGFSTSRFVRWFDEKYGVTRSGHDWVKAHFTTGVVTNVVTAVRIDDRDAADSPQFKPLVEATVRSGFTVKEMSGDKAYSSVENLELIAGLGGTAFIPFKSNASGAAGGLREKMFHYYSFNREEFLRHYHKRSNVESTVNMVKAKFRDHVRSRMTVAMKNETLCKFLCHNICVVIQSQCELGIEPVFWPDQQPKPDPQILAFPG